MSQEDLDVTKADGVDVVTFASSVVLDIATSQSMAKQILRLTDGVISPQILIDFSAVKFIASRMLGILVELTKRAEAHHGQVVVCGLRPDVHKVFRVMRLDELLTVVEDRTEAMKRLGAANV